MLVSFLKLCDTHCVRFYESDEVQLFILPDAFLMLDVFNAFDSVDDERCSRSFMSFGTAPSLVAVLNLWMFSGLAIAASFYLPSKCVRYFWLRLWHSTSSMKLHCVHFLPMLTLPWRNSRALIVTDANTRSFLLNGSCEHAHRLHSFIKNKSLSTNLNRKLPRLLDLCFYKLHYTDSKFLPRRTSFSMFYRRHRHDSCSRFTRVRCNVCYSHSFFNLLNFYYQSIFIYRNEFLKN